MTATTLPPHRLDVPSAQGRRDSKLEPPKSCLAGIPPERMITLDMKYFPKPRYRDSVATTTPFNDRQRQILGAVKAQDLTEIRRKSIDGDVAKAERPKLATHSFSMASSKGLSKRGRVPIRDRESPSRTLNPVLGAVSCRENGRLPEFVFREAMPSLVLPKDIAVWITMYFREPLAYHCYHYAEGMFLDCVHGQAISRGTLTHKARLLRMVNEYIDRFEDVDLELLIMAMTTMFKISTDDCSSSLSVPKLFTPHPDPEDVRRILTRVETVVLHSKALIRLLEQRGPDTPFEHFPGIENSMPLVDVIISSAHATHPRYQTHSIDLYTHCPNRLDAFPSLPSPDPTCGQGFSSSIPGTLPSRALAAYRSLAALDRLFTLEGPSVSGAHFKYFAIDPRINAVQHQLLSVPHWDTLSDLEKDGSSRVVYESCRIAAILYSNSVLHPVPASVGPWLGTLLAQLRYLLVRSGVPRKGHEAVSLAVWVSFIGAMASYGLEKEWSFFVGVLRNVCEVAEFRDWSEVEELLNRFLWSERACARGARVVWKAIGVER